MSDPEQLERELREYLEKEPNLRREDRLIYLRSIVNKYLEFNKLDHMINSSDLFDIFSKAKTIYTEFQLPLKIGKKQVESNELANVAMIESTLVHLNKMNLLKRIVKFDYTK